MRFRGLGALLFLAAGVAFSSSNAARSAEIAPVTCQKLKFAAFDAGPAFESRPRTIVAIGSSSTEGIARNARTSLYPAAMESALRQRWPQADVKVVNKGRGGETMADTLRRFETDVLALKPNLVIWQLGVNDVLRFQGVDGRRDEIKAGLKMLTDRSIPVILLDLQYAPVVIRDPDTGAMQDLIDSAARDGVRGRVFHFRRYAIMKDMAEKQAVPMADMTDPDGLHMTDSMHSCVGQLLAEMVVSGGAQLTARQ
jgi:acyl-CoA thioesterase I